MKSIRKLTVVISIGILFSACTTGLTGNNYSPTEARAVQEVSFGKVLNVRQVLIDGTNSGQGATVGGLAGAVGGSTYGTGNTNIIATTGGGLLGSVLGQGAELGVTRKKGVELVIAVDGGRTIALVQEVSADTTFTVGQRVRLMTLGGATRAIPDDSTAL